MSNMKIRIQVDDGDFRKELRDIEGYMNSDVPQKAYTRFRNLTPVRSGNARNKTKYRSGRDQYVISANYPYAVRLDNGWSDQARDGMSEPTLEYIEDLVQSRLRRS